MVLTKGNLARWNWLGNKIVAFVLVKKRFDCQVETYGEPFRLPLIYNHLIKLLIYLVIDLEGVGTTIKRQFLVGASALCWGYMA